MVRSLPPSIYRNLLICSMSLYVDSLQTLPGSHVTQNLPSVACTPARLSCLSAPLPSFFFLFFFFWPCCSACGILVPRPGIEPKAPATEGQGPNHWTAREFPTMPSLNRQSGSYFFFLIRDTEISFLFS